ncbi:MAG: CBS domain-containing protein [Archaeoglobi archaeon]|jgi:CBS domain-containing protein|nr:CBS domain-containing protein [Archaeoglobales archaeon]TDA28211.1 MAG: CBS domain-containing protein [Archaeoglobi archaeon]
MHTDLPVKEIMTTKVCKANIDESVEVIAKRMVSFGVGSAVIVQGNKPIGIVTEKDLIAKVVAKNKVPSSVKASEIMSTPLITIKPTTSVREAANLMIKKGIRRLPIVNSSGDLIGIITDNDILQISLDLGEFAALIKEHSVGYSEETSGICEKCGKHSDTLKVVYGLHLCEDCAEEER